MRILSEGSSAFASKEKIPCSKQRGRIALCRKYQQTANREVRVKHSVVGIMRLPSGWKRLGGNPPEISGCPQL